MASDRKVTCRATLPRATEQSHNSQISNTAVSIVRELTKRREGKSRLILAQGNRFGPQD